MLSTNSTPLTTRIAQYTALSNGPKPPTPELRAARADRLLNEHIDRVAAQDWRQASAAMDRANQIVEARLRWLAAVAHAEVRQAEYLVLAGRG